MLDFELNKKWSFSCADIFVSISNRVPFKIQDNSIFLYDLQDNYYEIDLEGNQIKFINSDLSQR